MEFQNIKNAMRENPLPPIIGGVGTATVLVAGGGALYDEHKKKQAAQSGAAYSGSDTTALGVAAAGGGLAVIYSGARIAHLAKKDATKATPEIAPK